MQRAIFLLISALLLSAGKGYGQLYSFKKYGLEEGIAQSQVLSICPDQRGDVWFGTYGGGACRFNGIDFEYFTTQNGLIHNSVWGVSQDAQGNLWFGTDGGLSIYDGYRYYNFTPEEGLGNEKINCILHTSNGQTYLGTVGGLTKVLSDKFGQNKQVQFKNLLTEDTLLGAYVQSIAEDKKGNLWLGTRGYGVLVYNNGEVKQYTKEFKLPSNLVNHVMVDDDDNVWVSTDLGITIFEENRSYMVNMINGNRLVNVEHVFQDRTGTYWISTITNGLYKGTPGNFEHLTVRNGLPINNIRNTTQDASGCVWVGTDGAGAVKYMESPFIHYTTAQGLTDNLVMSIETTPTGEVWVGTESGTVHIFKDGNIRDFQHPALMANSRISSIFRDRDNNIWIGTASNSVLKVKDEKVVKVYNSSDGLDIGSVNSVFQDAKGTIWFTGFNGIWNVEGGGLKCIAGEFITEQTWCATEDKTGNMWFGTSEGLVRYNDGEIAYFTAEHGLINEVVISVDIATDGALWLGTEEGIARFDGGKFKTFTVEDGLTSNNVYFSFFDLENNFIVGTEKGFDKITIDGDQLGNIEHYGIKEGFRGIECNANAFSIDKDGSLWFGTIKGATKYTPQKEQVNEQPPSVRLTDVQLFFEKVNWDSISQKRLTPWNRLPVNPELDYTQNHLTFNYIGVNMPNPERVTYQFKLDGFDNNWSPATSARQVTYSNLPHGKYTFMLKAANEDGVWSSTPLEFSFTIKTPFWLTWPFLLTSGVVLLALIIVVSRLRTLNLRKAKLKLEEQVRHRTSELREQKRELERLSIVAQEIQQGVLISDAEGNIEWANPGFEKMTGYNLAEFKEKFGTNIIEISSLRNAKEVVDKMKNNGEGISYEVKHQNAKGEDVWASCYITPIKNSSGQIVRFVSLYSDVTRLKHAERDAQQKNKDITDSIHYARHIQEAILPDKRIFYNAFPNSFILHLPKDIVSGDFYWFADFGPVTVVCVADCTGHGVPGAFMSMIGNEFLHQVVKEKDITGPDHALTEMDERIKRSLSQSGGKALVKDGMDIAMCAIHKDKNWLQYCGAHRPLLLVRNGEVIELKGQKAAIGGSERRKKKFVEQNLDLQKGDSIYMFTDGYTDQFGGPKNKKFLIKRMKELMLNIEGVPMPEQKEIFLQTLNKWKGETNQVDDILVVGLQVE